MSTLPSSRTRSPRRSVARVDRDEVIAALRRIPALAGIAPERIEISRLGGLTNANLRVETPDGTFALQMRVPDPEGYRSGTATADALRMAGRLDIGPTLVHADDQIIVTRWITRVERLGIDPRRAGALFARLHQSGERLDRHFDPFDAARRYADALGRSPLSAALADAHARAERGTPAKPVPIHGDPVPENFVDAGDRLLLLDWEYAGMGDPAWDLAYLSLEAGYTADDETQLRAAYRDPRMTIEQLASAKMVAASVAVLWGSLRAKRGQPPDLSAWIATRLRQAEALASVLYPDPGSG